MPAAPHSSPTAPLTGLNLFLKLVRFSTSGPSSSLFPLPKILVPQFLAWRLLLALRVPHRMAPPLGREHPHGRAPLHAPAQTPLCYFLLGSCLQQTFPISRFLYLVIAASTPRTEISLVSRSGPDCSKNSEHEEWRRKEEEVGEGSRVQSGRPCRSLSRLWFSHVSFIILYYYCLPYASHKAHRGRDRLFHSCYKDAPGPGTFSPLL